MENFCVNKLILGLLTVVLLLGMALVALNNQLKPRGPAPMTAVKQAPVDRLPALPTALNDVEKQTAHMPPPAEPVTQGNGNNGTARTDEANEHSLPSSPAGTDPYVNDGIAAPGDDTGTSFAADTDEDGEDDMVVADEAGTDSPLSPQPNLEENRNTDLAVLNEDAASKLPPLSSYVLRPSPDKAQPQQDAAAPAASADGHTAVQPDRTPVTVSIPVASQPRNVKKDPPADEGQKTASEKAAPAATKASETEKSGPGSAAAGTEKKQTAQAKPASGKSGIVVFSRETGATVRITLPRNVGYNKMLLTNPDRLVVDLTGEFKDLQSPAVPDNPLVSRVRLGMEKNRTRIVLDLKAAPRSHKIVESRDRKRIDIRVDK